MAILSRTDGIAHVSVKRRSAAFKCALCFIQTQWDASSSICPPKCVRVRLEIYTNAFNCVL